MTDRISPIGPIGGVVSATGGDPVRPVAPRPRGADQRERRSAERRAKDEAKDSANAGAKDGAKEQAKGAKKPASQSRELVPVGKVVDHDPAGHAARKATRTRAQAAAAAFAAQMLGQGGQRNGIRGGPPVMDNARSTYLGAQYSGEHERRPPVGTTTRKDV